MTAKRIDLTRAWFASRVEMDAEVFRVDCADAGFEAGAVLETSGEVDASGANFGAPSTISGAKMLSLTDADTSNLVLAETDLSECRFVGAHRLELLRIARRHRRAPSGRSSGSTGCCPGMGSEPLGRSSHSFW
jgi:hypothetical protein